jgi:hypothetical protein
MKIRIQILFFSALLCLGLLFSAPSVLANKTEAGTPTCLGKDCDDKRAIAPGKLTDKEAQVFCSGGSANGINQEDYERMRTRYCRSSIGKGSPKQTPVPGSKTSTTNK